jgi:hypothetical protein
VEKLTLIVRRLQIIRKIVERHSPPDFCSTFVITGIDNDPKSVGEVVDLVEGKL